VSVPLLAADFGDMSAALVPTFVNDNFDKIEEDVCDCLLFDSKRYIFDYIIEKRGCPQGMKKIIKN